MNRALINYVIFASGILASGQLLAGEIPPTITIGSDSGLPNDVIVIPVNYSNAGSDIAGVDIDVFFDQTQFSSVTVDCTVQTVGAGVNFCSDASAGSGRVDVILARIDGGAFTDGLLANITFTIAGGATAGSKLLDGVIVGLSDSGGTDLPLNTADMNDGSITVLGPEFSSTPAPGALNVGSAQQGAASPSVGVTIDNTGAAGTTLTGTCSETADPSGVFTLSGDTAFSVPEAGPNDTVTVSCSTATVGNFSGTMSCAHNGTNPSPQVYNLSCEITPGPTPRYGSAPPPGSTLDFGSPAKNSVDPELMVSIDNVGDPTTTLSGSCSITTNPNGAYAITAGGGAYSVLQGAAAHDVTVACDTAIPGDHDGGVLSCSHNGTNIASPATYTLNCNVPGEPVFAGTPNPNPLDLGPVPQNNTDPTGTLAIDNTGDPNSTLSGSCALTGGAGPIAIQNGGGAYSVTEAGAPHVVTVVCDSAEVPGVYNDTLSCSHDDPGQATPVNFPVSCTISQPDAAVFGSTPPSGSTIDITGGTPVVVGSTDPTAPLQIRNDADAGDADMNVSCSLSDVVGTAITAAPPVAGVVLAPGASQNVTFTCDTSAASAPGTPFEATYSCDWFSETVEPPLGTGFQESYTVTCEVRDPIADIEPNPAAGTTLTQAVEPGGSAQFQVVFNEVADEGIDGELSCSLDSGADFTILSPDFTSPVPVPAGGGVTVTVEGTDPGGVDSVSDTLRCTFFDSLSGEVGTEVTFPLVLLIGGNATFEVSKVFTDGNPGEVTVSISCNTGLPLNQSKVITPGSGVTFVVGDFDSGEMNCTIAEEPLAGYATTYEAGGASQSDSTDECSFFAISGGDDNTCVVTNTPDPVDVVITKDFVFEGSSALDLNTEFWLTLFCDAEIVGGSPIFGEFQEAPEGIIEPGCGAILAGQDGPQGNGGFTWCQTFHGDAAGEFTAEVIPEFPSSNCSVFEQVLNSAVEVENGCEELTVSAGEGASCTITNTVFFEGIPALNRYGLVLLALLMLGVGFVAYRRFA